MPWIESYEHFHKKNVYNNSKRLIYGCHGFHGKEFSCAGWGDRIREMIWGYRFAAATDRVLHIFLTHPFSLETVLQPNIVNWTSYFVESVEKINLKSHVFTSDLKKNYDKYKNIKDLYFSGNSESNSALFNYKNPEEFNIDHSLDSPDTYCIFKSLFKMSDALKKQVDERIESIYSSNTTEYVAVYLRSGGMIDEEVLYRGNSFNNLLGLLYCAKLLERKSTPILFIASDYRVRRIVNMSVFTNVVNINPVKIHHTYSNDHVEGFNTFLELGLLSQANCLVLTRPSGFGDIARWLGGNFECVRYVADTSAKNFKSENGRNTSRECFEELGG